YRNQDFQIIFWKSFLFYRNSLFNTKGHLNLTKKLLNLETSIEFLKGIGPERAKFIKNVLGIATVEDLLTFYPLRYIDKSKIYKIGELTEEPDAEIQLKGRITDVQEIGYGNGKKRMSAKFRDQTGTLELVWFRYSKWMTEQIPLNREI